MTITETAGAVDGETGDALYVTSTDDHSHGPTDLNRVPKITITLYHLAPALTVTKVSTTTLMQMIPCGTTDAAPVLPGQESPIASSANDVSSPELVTVTPTFPEAVVPPTDPVEPPPVTTSASEPAALPATSSVDIPNFSFSNIISAPLIETPAVPSETTAIEPPVPGESTTVEEAPAPVESSTATEPPPPSETSAPPEVTPPPAEMTQAPEETTGASSSTTAEASSSSIPATSETTTADPTSTPEPEPVDEETEAPAPTPTSAAPQSSLELAAGLPISEALPVEEGPSPTTRIGQASAASGAYTGVREGPSVILSGHTLVNSLYLGNLGGGGVVAAAAATGGPMTLGALRSAAATTAGGPMTLGVLAG
ncbi:hypothetical protein DL763_011201 [Monosporascus cannonballus]|nr:hypothetical protein DL763_011201 [Monosporascus cannonballus]